MNETIQRKVSKWLAFGAFLLAGASQLRAHDLWIVPGRFHLKPGESLRIFLNSGDEFPKSDSLLGEFRIASFNQYSATEQIPLTGFLADGKSLTAEMKAPSRGTVVLGLATKPRLVRLKADEFNEYLKEEGLLRVLEQRERRGETADAVVERYTKWAKAILAVGEGDDSWQKNTGMRIEIVPEYDPCGIKVGEALSVRVFFDNKPLSGSTLVGARAGGPPRELEAVTDDEGRARLTISEAGRWYIRTIHMIRLVDDPETQWESFWTTLTFEVQE